MLMRIRMLRKIKCSFWYGSDRRGAFVVVRYCRAFMTFSRYIFGLILIMFFMLSPVKLAGMLYQTILYSYE